jgi:hypothetical protein
MNVLFITSLKNFKILCNKRLLHHIELDLEAGESAFFASIVNIIVNSGQRPTEAGAMEPIPNWTAPAVARILVRALKPLPARLNFRKNWTMVHHFGMATASVTGQWFA